MIARINELPIQCLRSSQLQRWLQRTAPNNICQPGGSCEEAFLCLSLVLQSCHLRSPCFLLRTVYFFHGFSLLNPWAANYALLTLSLQFHLVSLHGSILCRLFQLLPSGQQISQKSELGLQKYCCVHAGSWITDSWTTARRVIGTTGYSGKLLTFSSEEPSLSLSDHVAAREQRAETHT